MVGGLQMLDPKIKTLLMIAEKKSYTQAADALHLTQPAVSHHIRQLEALYGIKIFSQDKRTLRFTEQGRILYQYAKQIHEIAQVARQTIEDSEKGVHHLRFGITQTVGETLIPQMIAQYGADHPETVITITTDTLNNLYDKLEDYALDIVIAEISERRDTYRSVLLDTDYLCVIVSPKHPLASALTVRLSDLKREKLILRSGSASTRIFFEHYLTGEAESIQNFQVMMEIDNIATIKDLVSMNYGVSIIAHSACRAEIEGGKLAAVTIENARLSRDVSMLFREDFEHLEILEGLQKSYHTLTARR